MAKKFRKYTAKYKREAVQLALNSPSVSSAVADLGISGQHCIPGYRKPNKVVSVSLGEDYKLLSDS